MYSKFDLTISDYFYNTELNEHLESGKRIYKKHEELTKKSLKEFIYDNGHIDGTSMKSNWFEIKDVDIFISHSHQDITKVKAFAGWLYDEFKLTAFIDSCVWGYCDDLLKQIDDKYCLKKSTNTYDYAQRNYTTSHVHMMLSTALTEMIDNTECIMFYNTPNSVSLVDDLKTIKNAKKKVTLSPWIFHELAITSCIRRRELGRKIPLLEYAIEHRADSEKNKISIEYDIDKYLKEMILVTSDDLARWKNKYNNLMDTPDNKYIPNNWKYKEVSPLDVLYFIKASSNY